MDKVSGIKKFSAPTLWVDVDDLHIPCAVPSLDAVEEIMEKAEQVVKFTSGRVTREGYDCAFDLFAQILSCNHNYVEFTPGELKNKRITIVQVIGVLTDWIQFIYGLTKSKN